MKAEIVGKRTVYAIRLGTIFLEAGSLASDGSVMRLHWTEDLSRAQTFESYTIATLTALRPDGLALGPLDPWEVIPVARVDTVVV